MPDVKCKFVKIKAILIPFEPVRSFFKNDFKRITS